MNQVYKHKIRIIFLAGLCGLASSKSISQSQPFDAGWRFYLGDEKGTEAPGFDDRQWRMLDLPHDWSIEDLADPVEGNTIGPFRKDSNAMKGGSTGHTVGGTGWYRKRFTLDAKQQGKLQFIYFEGVYMEADIWVNGTWIGDHKHGYTSFFFDITKACLPVGKENVLAVRVRNVGENSRWYSGSGIYRHVRLLTLNKVHFDPWGIFISTPLVSKNSATIHVEASLVNPQQEKQPTFQVRLLDATGKQVGESRHVIADTINNSNKVRFSIDLPNPKRWSTTHPYLYKAAISMWAGKELLDQRVVPFGIRSLRFDPVAGLQLNDSGIKLKGGCIHHDNGILGAAAIDRAEQRKVELLKAQGFNAIRTSHNPPSEQFLVTCDRLGMLVIDEAFDMWEKGKNPDDYHLFFNDCWKNDFSSMILRDRNHPSVILWSLGNEIQERADTSGLAILQKLKALGRELDPSRLCTMAVCEFWDDPGKPWSATAPTFALLDVDGYNYQWGRYESDHAAYPQRIIIGTESVPRDALQNWRMVEKHPYVIGDFVWTAIDYFGESGIGHTSCKESKDDFLKPWPWFNANCGDIDITGNKKPQSYYRDVVWGSSAIELAVHQPMADSCTERISYWGWPDELQSWTWPGRENKNMEVAVYSSYPVVRLKLNGKVIGEKMIVDSNLMTAQFNVPYAAGRLEAVGIVKGKEVGRKELTTAGIATSIRLVPDRMRITASRNDLAYVRVEIVDGKNKVVPGAPIPVSFAISGPGEIAAAGNADPAGMASFHSGRANTFRGTCLIIVRPTGAAGTITLTAQAPGVSYARLVLNLNK